MDTSVTTNSLSNNECVPVVDQAETQRRERYRQAVERLQQWAQEDPGYDERVGELLAKELKDASLACEDRDEATS